MRRVVTCWWRGRARGGGGGEREKEREDRKRRGGGRDERGRMNPTTLDLIHTACVESIYF
jgi:hypothetical protein